MGYTMRVRNWSDSASVWMSRTGSATLRARMATFVHGRYSSQMPRDWDDGV